MNRRHSSRRRGSALVVAVGILAVMSVMGFAFVSTMRIEYEAGRWFETRNVLDLLGTWAVQYVCDDLKNHPWQGMAWTPVDWPGESWWPGANTKNLLEPSGKEASLEFQARGSIIADFPGRGTVVIDRAVLDCHSMVNVNSAAFKARDGSQPNRVPVGDMIVAVAKRVPNLGTSSYEAIRKAILGDDSKDFEPYKTKDEIRKQLMASGDLGEQVGRGVWIALKPYLTIYAWEDPTTGPYNVDTTNDRSGILKFIPRAPINVNTASWQVLAAVFAGLRGSSEGVSLTIDDAVNGNADKIAKALNSRFNVQPPAVGRPICTWKEFDLVLDDTLKSLTPAIADEKEREKYRGLINANCNPNYLPSWMPRNAGVPPNWGKDKVIKGTTELCFTSFGRYELELETKLVRKLFSGIVNGVPGSGSELTGSYQLADYTVLDMAGKHVVPGTTPVPVWNTHLYRGKYLCVYSGPGEGQVRLIGECVDKSEENLADRATKAVNPNGGYLQPGKNGVGALNWDWVRGSPDIPRVVNNVSKPASLAYVITKPEARSHYYAVVQIAEPLKFTTAQHLGTITKQDNVPVGNKDRNFYPDRPRLDLYQNRNLPSADFLGMILGSERGPARQQGCEVYETTFGVGATAVSRATGAGVDAGRLFSKSVFEREGEVFGAVYSDGIYMDQINLKYTLPANFTTSGSIGMWIRPGPKFCAQMTKGTTYLVTFTKGNSGVRIYCAAEAGQAILYIEVAALSADKTNPKIWSDQPVRAKFKYDTPLVWSPGEWHWLSVRYYDMTDPLVSGEPSPWKNASVDFLVDKGPKATKPWSTPLKFYELPSDLTLGPTQVGTPFDCTIGQFIKDIDPLPTPADVGGRYLSADFVVPGLGSDGLPQDVRTRNAKDPASDLRFLIPEGAELGAIAWTEYTSAKTLADYASKDATTQNLVVGERKIYNNAGSVLSVGGTGLMVQSLGGGGLLKHAEADWKKCQDGFTYTAPLPTDPRDAGIYPLGRRGEGEPAMAIKMELGKGPALDSVYKDPVTQADKRLAAEGKDSRVLMKLTLEASTVQPGDWRHGAPTLDDITVYCLIPPKILYWRERPDDTQGD